MNHRDYPARLDRVVDGDTVDLEVDLGFRTHKNVRVRVKDIDTNEVYGVSKNTESFEIGERQSNFAEEFLSVDGEWPLTVRTYEEEKGSFGRWIGDIIVDGDSYAEAVLEKWPDASYE